jgi:hypothetical protein
MNVRQRTSGGNRNSPFAGNFEKVGFNRQLPRRFERCRLTRYGGTTSGIRARAYASSMKSVSARQPGAGAEKQRKSGA